MNCIMDKRNSYYKRKEVHLMNYRIHMIGMCVGMLLFLTIYSRTQEQATELKHCTENVEGQVFLEMWCHFPGKGEFFSRGLQNTLSGTTGWTTVETVFFLKKGENPDNVKLNLVIDGRGTIWIDDIHLLEGPLQ